MRVPTEGQKWEALDPQPSACARVLVPHVQTDATHRSRGECLPGVHPLSIQALAPPREIPQVDRTGPQTCPAKHVAKAEI